MDGAMIWLWPLAAFLGLLCLAGLIVRLLGDPKDWDGY